MGMFFRYLHVEFLKIKRLKLHLIHIGIPVTVAVIFLLYYSFSPWSALTKAEAYFQVLGIGFPIMIGLLCEMLVNQEAMAGSYYNLLSAQKKKSAMYALLSMLLIEGGGAVILASVLFGIGNCYILKQSPFGLITYVYYAAVLFACNILQYMIHLLLAFWFKRGVSVILSIAQSLLAALMLTGLGDRIWFLLPSAVATRLVSTDIQNKNDFNCFIAVALCSIITIVAFILYGAILNRFEGNRGSE